MRVSAVNVGALPYPLMCSRTGNPLSNRLSKRFLINYFCQIGGPNWASTAPCAARTPRATAAAHSRPTLLAAQIGIQFWVKNTMAGGVQKPTRREMLLANVAESSFSIFERMFGEMEI